MLRILPLFSALLLSGIPAFAAWTVNDSANTELPGRKVDIQQDGKLVARFIYGEGQIKPYLQLFGEDGASLNEWSAEQKYPHHRGFYIGWNKISYESSEAKPTTVDLWHLHKGGSMQVAKLEKVEARQDRAVIVASIEWRGNTKDASGEELLLKEQRTLEISKPEAKQTQVDATFVLTAVRDLSLGGDLQHAGVHFRASKELVDRTKETSYVWEPDVASKDGKASSTEFKWARLAFPVGERWYTATLMNAPQNPVQELSTRDYGRFGFFFTKDLKKDESLSLRYRLLVQREADLKAKPADAERTALSKGAAQEYQEFVAALK